MCVHLGEEMLGLEGWGGELLVTGSVEHKNHCIHSRTQEDVHNCYIGNAADNRVSKKCARRIFGTFASQSKETGCSGYIENYSGNR